jgi:hypothetical protein
MRRIALCLFALTLLLPLAGCSKDETGTDSGTTSTDTTTTDGAADDAADDAAAPAEGG